MKQKVNKIFQRMDQQKTRNFIKHPIQAWNHSFLSKYLNYIS
jgi:hypothetical protein